MPWTNRPLFIVVTRNRVRTHAALGQHFSGWDVEFSTPAVLSESTDTTAPLLVLVDHDSLVPAHPGRVVALVRRLYPSVRGVLLTSQCTAAVVNDAQLHSFETLVLIVADENLRRLGSWRPPGIRQTEQRVARLCLGYGLTDRECDVVRLAFQGRSRSEIARELELSVNSVRTLSRRILRRTGALRLAELPDHLETFVEDNEP